MTKENKPEGILSKLKMFFLILCGTIVVSALLIAYNHDEETEFAPIAASAPEECKYQDANVTITGCANVQDYLRHRIEIEEMLADPYGYEYKVECDFEVQLDSYERGDGNYGIANMRCKPRGIR